MYLGVLRNSGVLRALTKSGGSLQFFGGRSRGLRGLGEI